jgi:hypothetical protein
MLWLFGMLAFEPCSNCRLTRTDVSFAVLRERVRARGAGLESCVREGEISIEAARFRSPVIVAASPVAAGWQGIVILEVAGAIVRT